MDVGSHDPDSTSYSHPPSICPSTVQGNRNVTVDEVFDDEDDEPLSAGYDGSEEDDGWRHQDDELEEEQDQWDHGLDDDGVAPWLQGVSASDQLAAEFEAEAALRGTLFFGCLTYCAQSNISD